MIMGKHVEKAHYIHLSRDSFNIINGNMYSGNHSCNMHTRAIGVDDHLLDPTFGQGHILSPLFSAHAMWLISATLAPVNVIKSETGSWISRPRCPPDI